MSSVILIANDNLIKLSGLRDVKTGDYQNDATVQVTLKDQAGNTIDGQSWPLTLNHIAGSDGDYDGVLEDTLGLSVNTKYVVEISGTIAGGSKMFVQKLVTAVTRTS